MKAPRGTYKEGVGGDDHLSEHAQDLIGVLANASKAIAFLLTAS